jgi:hypothetical protein
MGKTKKSRDAAAARAVEKQRAEIAEGHHKVAAEKAKAWAAECWRNRVEFLTTVGMYPERLREGYKLPTSGMLCNPDRRWMPIPGDGPSPLVRAANARKTARRLGKPKAGTNAYMAEYMRMRRAATPGYGR